MEKSGCAAADREDYHGEGLLCTKRRNWCRLTFYACDARLDKPASLKYITHCAVDNAEVFYY